MLVGWSRLLGGRIRDPLIGRDVLIGVAAGAAMALIAVASPLVQVTLGMPEPTPHLTEFDGLMGSRYFALTWLGGLNSGLQNALISVFTFAGLRAVFDWLAHRIVAAAQRRWTRAESWTVSDTSLERLFVVLAVLVSVVLSYAGSGPVATRAVAAVEQGVSAALTLLVLLRIGIFACAVMFFVQFLLLRVPLTFDTRALYAGEAWFTLAVMTALAAAGMWLATRSGTPAPAGIE